MAKYSFEFKKRVNEFRIVGSDALRHKKKGRKMLNRNKSDFFVTVAHWRITWYDFTGIVKKICGFSCENRGRGGMKFYEQNGGSRERRDDFRAGRN